MKEETKIILVVIIVGVLVMLLFMSIEKDEKIKRVDLQKFKVIIVGENNFFIDCEFFKDSAENQVTYLHLKKFQNEGDVGFAKTAKGLRRGACQVPYNI